MYYVIIVLTNHTELKCTIIHVVTKGNVEKMDRVSGKLIHSSEALSNN